MLTCLQTLGLAGPSVSGHAGVRPDLARRVLARQNGSGARQNGPVMLLEAGKMERAQSIEASKRHPQVFCAVIKACQSLSQKTLFLGWACAPESPGGALFAFRLGFPLKLKHSKRSSFIRLEQDASPKDRMVAQLLAGVCAGGLRVPMACGSVLEVSFV